MLALLFKTAMTSYEACVSQPMCIMHVECSSSIDLMFAAYCSHALASVASKHVKSMAAT